MRRKDHALNNKKRSHSSKPDLVYIEAHQLAHLLQNKGKELVADEWQAVHQALIEKRKNDVWSIDTEFGRSKGKQWLFEVAILDSRGKCILNSKIDHGCTVKELFDMPGMDRISQRHLCKIYDVRYESKEMATTRTSGITLKDLELELYRLGASKKKFLQWATGQSDYFAFANNIPAECFPPKEQWFQIVPVWRQIIPGIRLKLEHFYPALFPNCPLNESHHRAKVDAQKLYRAAKEMMKYVRFNKLVEAVKTSGSRIISVKTASTMSPKRNEEVHRVRKSVRKTRERRGGHSINEVDEEGSAAGESEIMDVDE
jgi:hypothetical protein